MTRRTKSPIWALTSLFNPTRSARRRINYHRFRDALPIPLITVELSFDGTFELSPDDADILLQVQTSTLLWHKESLQNLALDAVPETVPYVAWIDCDVLFPNPSHVWMDELLAKLEQHRLVQMFDRLYDLGPDESLQEEIVPPPLSEWQARSVASTVAHQQWSPGKPFPLASFQFPRTSMSGIAWAGRTDIMKKHRLYDGMIAGSGTRALAAAAYGQHRDLPNDLTLSPSRAGHFLSWAEPFYQSILGDVGFLSASVLHLWHGEFVHRQYGNRHEKLAQLGIDLTTDLERDASGLWRWKRPRPDLEEFFSSYFRNRQEDGATPMAAENSSTTGR